MAIADEIERLRRLKESGAITEEEFVQAKQRVLTERLPSEDDRSTPSAKTID